MECMPAPDVRRGLRVACSKFVAGVSRGGRGGRGGGRFNALYGKTSCLLFLATVTVMSVTCFPFGYSHIRVCLWLFTHMHVLSVQDT